MSDEEGERVSITRTFELGELLGEGGMGTIQTAKDVAAGQGFAVKRLRREHAADDRQRRLFRAEAATTAAIDHPGTVTVYGIGETEDGLPFYAMQQLEGQTLDKLLLRRGSAVSNRFWIDRLLAIFVDVCRTVAYAHERGIAHRDLKPDNVLCTADGSAYVLDWGVAGAFGTEPNPREAGLILGTPGYMAPEQATGDAAHAGPRADVFSLGVILYYLLTGVEPFAGGSPEQQISAVLHRRPKPVRRVNRWVSRSLAAICEKAIEPDPYRRYADAGALLEDLSALLEGRSVSVGRPSPIERWRAFVHRRPAAAALTGALAAVALALSCWLAVHFELQRRLIERDLRAIAAVDLGTAELRNRADEAQDRLAEARSSSGDPALLRELHARARELRTRQLVSEMEALMMMRDVGRIGLPFGRGERLDDVWRRIEAVAETAHRSHHPLVALGLVTTLREIEAEGELTVELDDERRRTLAEIERRATLQLARIQATEGTD